MRFRIVLCVLACFICILMMGLAKKENFPDLKGPYLGQKPPGMIPELFAPGIVSIEIMNHSTPVFSPDGREVYWSKIFEESSPEVRIIFSQFIDDLWTEPAVVPFASEFDEDCPAFSPDGQRLYFTSHRPIQTGDPTEKENIWFVEREGGKWSDPQPMPQTINRDPKLHWQLSLAKNGNIYFSTNHGFKCSEFVEGEYKEARYIRNVFGSDYEGNFPFIAADESYIVFASNQLEGPGDQYDLFIGFRKSSHGWTKPINLGKQINSQANDFYPVVTPDGKYLFFLSSRRGEYDVYWVSAKIIEELRHSVF